MAEKRKTGSINVYQGETEAAEGIGKEYRARKGTRKEDQKKSTIAKS